MAENNTIGKLILGFLVLIVGLALIGTVATSSLLVTEKTDVLAESLDIANARINSGACPMSINDTYPLYVANLPTGWKASGECPITLFSMTNQTDVAATVTTDYIIYGGNGSLYLKNTSTFVLPNCSATETGISNTTALAYTYCGDDYLNIAWGRTIINLVVGFFALALLGVSVGIFYSIARDTGILQK